jgi:methylamine dehydrogenase accessory protein MauD
MMHLFLISFAGSWLILIALGLMITLVLQRVGEMLLEGAGGHHPLVTDDGPQLHEKMVEFSGRDMTDRPIAVSDFRGRPLVVLFLSLACRPCEELLGELTPTRRYTLRKPEFLLVLEAGYTEARRLLQSNWTSVPAIVDPGAEIRTSLGIARVPFGVLVDEDGVARMKGVTNTRRHLEALVAGRGHMASELTWLTLDEEETS